MKLISILLFFLIQTTIISGQCNVRTNYRSDGTVVKYLNPELVGKGNNCELGLSVQTDGSDFFLSTTVLYFVTPKKQIGNLKIQLSNNQSLELELVSSHIASLGNNQVGLGIFNISAGDRQKLVLNTMKTIVFTEESGNNQVVMLDQNIDVVQRHLKCLKQN